MSKAFGPNSYPICHPLVPRRVAIDAIKPPPGRKARKHPTSQLKKIARSLERFGQVVPVLVDDQDRLIDGAAVMEAARLIGLDEVLATSIDGLSEAEVRALRLALNRIGEDGAWDAPELSLELGDLSIEADLLLSIGFETPELDGLLAEVIGDEEDVLPVPETDGAPISQAGDLWRLGDHRLLCGDAIDPSSYATVLSAEKADIVFTDPPYNRAIRDVAGLGRVAHPEFVEASGEMTAAEFTAFLRKAVQGLIEWSVDGSIHYVCMDWRHTSELMAAASDYTELKNICVWAKTNAGMGSLYRSQHEFVFVFKNGKGPHVNNVELGRHGRSRSNIWAYPGQNALSGTSRSKLSLHPTVKPVALIADALRDCSDRGAIVLDPFGGAGTTMIAAEKTGRRARLIELDPRYVDVAVRRWQWLTGRPAVHDVSGVPFPLDPKGGTTRGARR